MGTRAKRACPVSSTEMRSISVEASAQRELVHG
jgi:hypothetical protein